MRETILWPPRWLISDDEEELNWFRGETNPPTMQSKKLFLLQPLSETPDRNSKTCRGPKWKTRFEIKKLEMRLLLPLLLTDWLTAVTRLQSSVGESFVLCKPRKIVPDWLKVRDATRWNEMRWRSPEAFQWFILSMWFNWLPPAKVAIIRLLRPTDPTWPGPVISGSPAAATSTTYCFRSSTAIQPNRYHRTKSSWIT